MDSRGADRVWELAERAIEQAELTRRAIDELLAELGSIGLDAPAGRETARARDGARVVPLDPSLDAARLAAIEMAVSGHTRDEVGGHLQAVYAVPDLEALLDDVFGPPEDRRDASSF